MRTKVIVCLTLLSFAQAIGQIVKGDKKDLNTIQENTKNFSRYVIDSNYKMIANSYTKDAKIFPNRTKILQGEDIIKYWTLPEGVSTSYHKITQSEITIVENTAYDYGYYEGKTKHKDGKISSWKGKYVIVWKKVNNDWKMYLDIWNQVVEK